MKFSLICLAILIASSMAFYEEGSDVVKLTAANFKEQVLDSDDFWLVEFYAPWCGHCKKLTPEWERAAKGLKGMFKLGAVDMTTDGDAGKDYNIEGYPTLKFFGEDKSAPQEYEGGRTSVGIINFAAKKLKEIANGRIGNKKRAKPQKQEEKKPEEEEQPDQDDGDVVVITDDNFTEEVENSKDAWFIEFYAPWCGHCKNLAPTWKKLASQLKGKVKIAKVDSTQNSSITQRFGVKGYPSLKFFPGGAKSDSTVEEYNGSRDIDALEQWATERAALSLPAKFGQLTSQDVFADFCENIRGVCIVVFLPNLLESSLEQRESYISQIDEVANINKGKPFTFLWSEGGQQQAVEQKFNVGGSGYPAILAISTSKSKYAILRQSFTAANLSGFVSTIGSGKQVFSSYNEKVQVQEIEAWDGKDVQKEKKNEDL